MHDARSVLAAPSLLPAIEEAKRCAQMRLAAGQPADEFVKVSRVGGCDVYVAASQDLPAEASIRKPRANPNDCLLYVLEGSVEVRFAGEYAAQRLGPGGLLRVPANAVHTASFQTLTVYLAVVENETAADRRADGTLTGLSAGGTVRRVAQGDLDATRRFVIEYHAEPNGAIIEGIVALTSSLTGLWFTPNVPGDTQKDLPFQRVLSCHVGDVLAGFLMFTSLDGSLQITLMGAALEFHRQGIGSRLVDALKRVALELGFTSIKAMTVPPSANPRYAATVAFYEKNGFHQVRFYPDLWEHGAMELECRELETTADSGRTER